MALEQLAALVTLAGAIYGLVIAAQMWRQGYVVKRNVITRQETARYTRESDPVRFYVVSGGVVALSCGMLLAALGLWLRS